MNLDATTTTIPIHCWVAASTAQAETVKPRYVQRPPTNRCDAGTEIYTLADGTEFQRMHEKLDRMAYDDTLWDDGGPPGAFSVEWARIALGELMSMSFLPDRVVASAEGGTAICFLNGDRYADIEFLNSEKILAVTSDRRSMPTVWPVPQTINGLIRTLGIIRDYLRPA